MVVFIILVCLCIVLVAALVGATASRGSAMKGKMPPGPRGAPIVGHGFRLNANTAYLTFTEWAKEYGNIFMFSMFGKKVVVLNDPDIIRRSFVDADLACKVSDRPPSFMGYHIGSNYKDVLFREYDDVCAKLKTATLSAMATVRAENVDYDRLYQQEVNEYIKKVANKGGDIDLMEPLGATLCKLIGIMFSGEVLADNDPVFLAIMDFDIAGNEMILPMTHLMYKVMPFLRYMPFGYYGNLFRKTVRSKNELKIQLLNRIKVDKRYKETDSLLAALFHLQNTETWLTDDYILGVVMDLINTSTLTSRGGIGGIFFLLVHFQNVQERIRQEIDEVVGTERQPVPGDLANMPYTHAVIMETLRYQTHLPITATHANANEDVEIEGYHIPKGTSFFGNQWSVHHDERYWPDPYVFNPERFLTPEGQLIPADCDQRTRYYIPFGVGNRACMGIRTTYDRMFLFVSCLLQTHRILPPTSEHLPSSDARDLTPGTVLLPPEYKVRITVR